MELRERIKDLTALRGLSGAEGPVARYLAGELARMGIPAEIDRFGNVHGHIQTTQRDAKTILLEAHMDQIGLATAGADSDGYIRFINLGGVDERILCGMEVTLLTQPPRHGVIGAYLPKTKEGEEVQNAQLQELRIDAGLTQQEAEALVPAGTGVMLGAETVELLDGKLSGGALDNRAGVAAALDCVSRCVGCALPYHLSLLFSTQEELGLHGAYTGVAPDSADAAIVVDVTHGLTPDAKEETGVFPLGSGAVICRGPNLHHAYTLDLLALARREQIPYAIEVAPGPSGTTAWAVQTTGKGIPVLLVSIPLRYMHTNVETLALTDVQAVSDLLYAAVKGGLQIA